MVNHYFVQHLSLIVSKDNTVKQPDLIKLNKYNTFDIEKWLRDTIFTKVFIFFLLFSIMFFTTRTTYTN
jgi:hypothetical protein